jgi:hypothetical protein
MRFLLKTVIVIVALAIPSIAKAADSISFTSGYPTSSSGSVNCVGTYTLNSGDVVNGITVYAVLPGGGAGGQVGGSYSMGNWGGLVSGLATGTYDVFARITITNGSSTTYWDTPTVSVSVP